MTVLRRYTFKLYPAHDQAAVLHEQRRMVGELWNALLQRCEDVNRRTVQRQTWHDADGRRHRGVSVHEIEWPSAGRASGEVKMFPAGRMPSQFDLQNEVTYLCNVDSDWRKLSVHVGHRVATLLDRAFKAFFSRASQGAGISSGYPRYKRVADHPSIPHRFASGCRLGKNERHELSWTLYLKGVPGIIHARGRVPAEVEAWTEADVMWRDGRWWLSAACRIAERRGDCRPSGIVTGSGRASENARRAVAHGRMIIRFDLLDYFASVNGHPEVPPGLETIYPLQEEIDELKSVCDVRWPRGRRVPEAERGVLRETRRRISHLSAISARIRANALHVWSTRIVERSTDITIIIPPIKEVTRTPRGDEREWGAQVETVSELNRGILSLAPAMARAMLAYKSEEAGIRCDVVEDAAPVVAVGADLVRAGKSTRRLGRIIRREAA